VQKASRLSGIDKSVSTGWLGPPYCSHIEAKENLMFLPAKATNTAGDLLFVSTLFPIDEAGAVVRSDAISPYVGESTVATQTRHVLHELQRILETERSRMEQVLKVEVQLAVAEDFHEFKVAWAEMFGDTPPARTTVVIGEEDWILPGCRVAIAATAIAGGSSLERETIHTDEAPDPMPYEHVPQATKAGPWVFPSALTACDFESGIPVGKRLPRFPYYANDATAQAHYVLDNVDKVCRAAGTAISNTVKSQLYEPDLHTFPDVDAVWAEKMPVPPTRSSMGAVDLLVPRAVFQANLIVVAPDEDHQIAETREGISWHPVDIRKVNFTPGLKVGDDWLFLAGQVAAPDYVSGDTITSPPDMPHYASSIEIQTEATMGLLMSQITANGFALADVVDARIYLVHAQRDYRGFDRAWRKIYAEHGVTEFPSMNIIASRQRNGDTGIMWPGPEIEIDLIAKRS
jgi:enamine deaminase RidA (YjgF/YER057c/UK114 family)